LAKLFGVPELGDPTAARIKYRKSLAHLAENGVGLGAVLVRCGDRKLEPRVVVRKVEGSGSEMEIFANNVGFIGRFDRIGEQESPRRFTQAQTRKAPTPLGARDLGDHG